MVKTNMALSELAIAFRDSMPAAYQNAFGETDIEEHAQIASERGQEPARVAVWRTLPQGLAILCVVTEDRPGLVALVSAAFLAHALDVRAAQIYCRSHREQVVEAVDFFWLRNVTGGLPEASRLDACARTIHELLQSANGAPELEPRAGTDCAARISYSPDPTTPEQWEVVLEARDFPGLLHTVARLLHQHGLEVVRCEIRTEDGIARDRFFVASFTGASAEPQLRRFQGALLNVIDAVDKTS
jgi:UTP:GlnB (protein PII) uridylyltransferase